VDDDSCKLVVGSGWWWRVLRYSEVNERDMQWPRHGGGWGGVMVGGRWSV
jgi:hypothetical protein